MEDSRLGRWQLLDWELLVWHQEILDARQVTVDCCIIAVATIAVISSLNRQ